MEYFPLILAFIGGISCGIGVWLLFNPRPGYRSIMERE